MPKRSSGKGYGGFEKIGKNSPYRQEMLNFAANNLTNTRNSAKRKAEKLVKKLKG